MVRTIHRHRRSEHYLSNVQSVPVHPHGKIESRAAVSCSGARAILWPFTTTVPGTRSVYVTCTTLRPPSGPSIFPLSLCLLASRSFQRARVICYVRRNTSGDQARRHLGQPVREKSRSPRTATQISSPVPSSPAQHPYHVWRTFAGLIRARATNTSHTFDRSNSRSRDHGLRRATHEHRSSVNVLGR